MTMRGREGRGGAPNSADLLVCFPPRAHLTLMPKAICSPVRPSEPNKRHHNHNRRSNYSNQHLHLKKYSGTRGGGGQSSPLLWAKTKSIGPDIIDEPTSPKVTCAGQIRVRPKTAASCKNWQSVMEEIERIHNKTRKQKKKPSWMEALGFKKEVMQFLTCLRSLRLDFRCFGSLPGSGITSDEEDEDDEDEESDQYHQNHVDHVGVGRSHDDIDDADDDEIETSRTVFSKWFMVLQENQNQTNPGFCGEDQKEKIKNYTSCDDNVRGGEEPSCVPPPNALLLMRCRSAPAKSWLEEKAQENEQDDQDGDDHEEEEEEQEAKSDEKVVEDNYKENSSRESLMQLMRYDTDFYKISSDIAKETWVVGGIRDVFSRSRSQKR